MGDDGFAIFDHGGDFSVAIFQCDGIASELLPWFSSLPARAGKSAFEQPAIKLTLTECDDLQADAFACILALNREIRIFTPRDFGVGPSLVCYLRLGVCGCERERADDG